MPKAERKVGFKDEPDEEEEEEDYVDGAEEEEDDDDDVADEEEEEGDLEDEEDDDEVPISKIAGGKKSTDEKPSKRAVAKSDDDTTTSSKKSSTKKKKRNTIPDEGEEDDEESEAPPPARKRKEKSSATAASNDDHTVVETVVKKQKKTDDDDGDNVREAIEQFVMSGNRPLGVQHVVETIGGLDKGVAASILDGLERQGILSSKCLAKGGSMKLYWKDQSKIAKLSREDREQEHFEAREKSEQARDLDAEALAQEKIAASIEAQPYNSQLETEIERASKQVAALESRVTKRAGKKPVTKAQMVKACKAHNAQRTNWVKRKRAFKECMDLLADNMDEKPKALQTKIAEKQDIETDEDLSVVLPIPDLLPVPN